MKKMFALVALLVVAVCALSIVNCNYDTTPAVIYSGGEAANAAEDAATSTDEYYELVDETEAKPGEQYEIIAKNDLYGDCDYGDYVPAKVRYFNGFPSVDGDKKNSQYYEDKPYIPASEEKPWEEWNLHDFHANGEFFESIGNGTMRFATDEDRDAYAKELKDEFGSDNVQEYDIDENGKGAIIGNGIAEGGQGGV